MKKEKVYIGYMVPEDLLETGIAWTGSKIYSGPESIRHCRPEVKFNGILRVELRIKWTRRPKGEDKTSQSQFYR